MLWTDRRLKQNRKTTLIFFLLAATLACLFVILAPQTTFAASWVSSDTINHEGDEYTNTGGQEGDRYIYRTCTGSSCGTTPSQNEIRILVDHSNPDSGTLQEAECEGSIVYGTETCDWVNSGTVEITGAETDGPGTGDGAAGEGEEDDGPVCQAGAFGWLICPFISASRDFILTVSGWIGGILELNPLSFDSDDAVFQAWQNVLVIANVLLVIAFLVIIFSQATSLGLSSYGIKSMLPRVIAAAILMNLSYFIAAIMVDVSNIIGNGMTDLLLATTEGIGDSGPPNGLADGIQSVIGLFTAAGVWITAGIGIVIAVLVIGFIPVVLAILILFIILAARIAIIITLVMVAPLAFAAWILPNTEKYYKKWLDLFMQMLLIYPVLMALFAGAVVASTVVANAGGSESGGDITNQLMAMFILVVPLFALPFVVKTTAGTIDRLGGALNRGARRMGADKADGFVRQRQKDFMETRMNELKKAAIRTDDKVPGGILGEPDTRRRKFARNLMQSQKDRKERLNYSKIGVEAAERTYFGNKIQEEDYANQIVGGDKAMVPIAQGYGVEAIKSEEEKDINAIFKQLDGRTGSASIDQDTGKVLDPGVYSEFIKNYDNMSAEEAGAKAKYVAMNARGEDKQDLASFLGRQERGDKRRMGLQQLVRNGNLGSHFGYSGPDRSAMEGDQYTGNYEAGFVDRVEKKLSGADLLAFQSHDISTSKAIAAKGSGEGGYTDEALASYVAAVASAKNSVEYSKLKPDAKIAQTKVLAEAMKRSPELAAEASRVDAMVPMSGSGASGGSDGGAPSGGGGNNGGGNSGGGNSGGGNSGGGNSGGGNSGGGAPSGGGGNNGGGNSGGGNSSGGNSGGSPVANSTQYDSGPIQLDKASVDKISKSIEETQKASTQKLSDQLRNQQSRDATRPPSNRNNDDNPPGNYLG